jgi:hypothetical protein
MSDISRMGVSFSLFPAASFQILQRKLGLGLGAVSARFLREIPIFAKYFVYYRVISWSPDGRYMYMQAIFTMKGKRRSQDYSKSAEFPSIIPEDEIICAVLYVCHIMKFINGRAGRFEEVFALDGFDCYDERVQKMRDEGWEYVKDLHEGWEKERNFQSARRIGPRL